MTSDKRRFRGNGIGLCCVGALMAVACSAADTRDQETGVAQERIIGGVDAESSSLNAVGALVQIFRVRPPATEAVGMSATEAVVSGRFNRSPVSSVGMGNGEDDPGDSNEEVTYAPLCTGTLIGPKLVLTAEHCVGDWGYYPDEEFAFAVGPDPWNPDAVYPIIEWDWESAVGGLGWMSMEGSDVGVVHLATAVDNVVPLAVGSLEPSDVGKRFAVVGYGDHANISLDNDRNAGTVLLRGFGGNYVDYAFGGLEEFLEAAPSTPAFADLSEEELIELYDELALIDDYQAFLGGGPGDAQPCYGDSGGPMLAVRDGQRTVFGVVTGGFGSRRLVCDFGTVFSVFGPLALDFIHGARQWVDPCEGVTTKGHCEGDAAIRCTRPNEGKRRVVRMDCDLLGQTCGTDDEGDVTCVDL